MPVRHFGVVTDVPTWETLAAKLRSAGTRFIIEPYTRFAGEPGEQATMFFLDPFGNALEFKAFRDMDKLFAT
jgi:extradiol dioxygenase family protein